MGFFQHLSKPYYSVVHRLYFVKNSKQGLKITVKVRHFREFSSGKDETSSAIPSAGSSSSSTINSDEASGQKVESYSLNQTLSEQLDRILEDEEKQHENRVKNSTEKERQSKFGFGSFSRILNSILRTRMISSDKLAQ